MLASGVWTHDFPIRLDTARALGIPVTTGMPAEIHVLMALYPQPTRHRPSVEYVPVPSRPDRQDRQRTRGEV